MIIIISKTVFVHVISALQRNPYETNIYMYNEIISPLWMIVYITRSLAIKQKLSLAVHKYTHETNRNVIELTVL